MSKFSEKAATNSANVTVLQGREGPELKVVAQRLLTTLSITTDKVDDYFEAFSIFPLDKNKRVTLAAIQSFYEAAGLDLSEDDCRNAMKAFTGNELTFSLDFETYVINMERWARKVFLPLALIRMCTLMPLFVLCGSLRRFTRMGYCTLPMRYLGTEMTIASRPIV